MDEVVETADEVQAYLHGRPIFFSRRTFKVFDGPDQPENLADFVLSCDDPYLVAGGVETSEGVLNLVVFHDPFGRPFGLLTRNVEMEFERRYDGATFDLRESGPERQVTVHLEYQIFADHTPFVSEEQETWLIRSFVAHLIDNRISGLVRSGGVCHDYKVN